MHGRPAAAKGHAPLPTRARAPSSARPSPPKESRRSPQRQRALTGPSTGHILNAVSTINTTQTKGGQAPERAKLIDDVIESLGAVRARGMQGVRHLRRSAVSVGHLQVLVRLQMTGPLPISRLASLMVVSAAGATGLVNRMEERGLVERVRDAGDRRVVLVRLAPKGSQLLDEVASRARESLVRVLTRMSDDDLTQLRNGLKALQRAGEAVAEEDERDRDDADGPDGCRPPGDGRARDGRESRGPHAAEDPE